MAISAVQLVIRIRDEVTGVLSSVQTKLTAVAAVVASYFGVTLFADAIKSAAEFEEAMSRVQAATGASGDELNQLKQTAIEAGSSTKYTSIEAASALEDLAKSGLSATDAIAALPAVLQLAQAGSIELGRASEFMTAAVMGMGLQFSDAGRVADVLAMGANASKTSVSGLAEALSYTAPIATALGLSLESTVAIIGKFADSAIDASRAGTALNSILSQFSDPSSKFRTELAGAGITTNDFETALRQLAEAGQRGQGAILAVGTESGPALRALLRQGMGALDDLRGKLVASGGSAAETAAIVQNNLLGAFAGLASAWDTVKTTLGEPALPVLKSAVEQLTGSLKNAVSDGTVTRFGEALAESFRAGIAWAKNFTEQFDPKQVALDMRSFADQAGAAFAKIGEYASAAGNSAQLAYGVMSAGANTVMGVVYLIGVAYTEVVVNIQSGVALIVDSLAKVTFGDVSKGLKEAGDTIRLSAEATSAASDALAQKSAEAFLSVADGAAMARKGFDGLANASESAAQKSGAAAQAQTEVATALRVVGNTATETGQKAQAAGTAQAAAAKDTQAAVAKLKAEYEAALAAGNVQLAVEKLQALQGELKKTSTQAKVSAEQMAKNTADAFAGLGLTSQATLKGAAESARVFYNQIKSDASSTALDVGNAFKAMAEKAIAANGGIAAEALKSEAAMRGFRIETDAAGKSIVKALDGAKDGFGQVTPAIKTAEEAMKKLGITSDATLKKTAAESESAFGVLARSGTASARELGEAFRRSAADAIAANGGIAPSWVAAEAAARAYEVVVDSAGKTTVQAADTGAGAVDGLAVSYNNAANAAERLRNAPPPNAPGGGGGGGGDAPDTRRLTDPNRIKERNANLGKVPGAGRKAPNGEEMGEGVTAIGSGGQYRNKDGMASDAKGNGLVMSNELSTRTGIKNFLKSSGVTDDEEANRITNEFADAKGDITYFNNPGQIKYGGRGSTMSMALLKAAEQFTFGKSSGAVINANAITPTNAATPPPAFALPPAAPPPAASQNTYLVKIDLGKGPAYEVNMASANDAQTLIAALQNAKRGAGG